MSQKRSKANAGVSIGGNVNTNGGDIAGGDITKGNVYQSTSINTSEIENLFQPVYEQIESLKKIPAKKRKLVKKHVEEIQSEVLKGKKRDEGFIEECLKNIASMTPDILEVVLSTLANPIIGLGVVVKKVAEKYIQEKSEKDVKKNER